jgi:23S rRNA (uracil1939-C5)-methyltransferase
LCFQANEHAKAQSLQLIVDFAINCQIAQIAWQVGAQTPYLVIELKKPTLKYLDYYIDLPINSFVQASQEAQNYMIEIILANLNFKAKILELYCGCGSFTIAIAKHGKIDAYEGAAQAVIALTQAAARHNLAIVAMRRDLYQNPLLAKELNVYQQVVINPPRNGATPQIKQIALAEKIKTVILISCSLENFKRDAIVLIKSNFVLQKVYPVDQFIYTSHVEIIGVFHRR